MINEMNWIKIFSPENFHSQFITSSKIPIACFTPASEIDVIMEIGICSEINALAWSVKVFPDGPVPL